jgi:LPS export ABC transporter protein LptC
MGNFSIKSRSIAALVAVLFLFACQNNKKEVSTFKTKVLEEPSEVQKNLTLTYSDSAFKRMEMFARVAENYAQLEEPEMRFPKGIEVEFFDAEGKPKSRLRADRAIYFTKKKMWEAYGNVVVVNEAGDQLNTEELFWDEREHRIYSNAFTKISSPDRVIMGEGFESDENFDNPVITKVTGEIYLQDEQAP